MKALTWHGKRDVRVDDVPDPTIEEPTDAIVRDHLDRDLRLGPAPLRGARPVPRRGRHPRPRADGHRRGGRAPTSRDLAAGRPRRDPVQHLLRPLLHVRRRGLQSQCETTQVHEHGKGAALFGYTKLYGQVPGGQAELPARAARPTTARSRSPRARPTTASSTSPTCCPPRGRRSSTPTSRRAAPSPSSASARSATCARRIAQHRGRPRDRRRPRARAPASARAATASRCSTSSEPDDVAERDPRADRRPRARRRHRRRRHGGARLAASASSRSSMAGLLPDALAREADGEGRRRPAGRAATWRSSSSAAAARSRSSASTAARPTRCR